MDFISARVSRLFFRNVYRTAGRDASKGPLLSTTIVGSSRVGGNPTRGMVGGRATISSHPPRWGRPWGDTVRDPWISDRTYSVEIPSMGFFSVYWKRTLLIYRALVDNIEFGIGIAAESIISGGPYSTAFNMSAEPIEVLFIDSSPIHSSGPLLYYVKEGDPYLYIGGGGGGDSLDNTCPGSTTLYSPRRPTIEIVGALAFMLSSSAPPYR